MKTTTVDALERAVQEAGGQSSFAVKLTEMRPDRPVSQALVWNWLRRDKRAPSDVCPDIEAITGVRCEDLRPDVNWSVLRGTAPNVSAKEAA